MAIAVTGLAVVIAAASACGRASGLFHQVLVAGISVSAVIAVHMAPAFLRSMPKLVLWPFWSLCLAGAMYMHSSFMTTASSDAAAERLASSPAAIARAEQRAAIEHALSSIKARPATQIARQLSWATDPQRVAALQVELKEAQRADALRAQLVSLAAGTVAAASGATADPVAQHLASMLGVAAESLGLAAALLMALLLELFGMMLWYVGLSNRKRSVDHADIAQPQATPIMQKVVQVNLPPTTQASMQDVVHPNVHDPVQLVADDLSRLSAAIERDECGKTVADIRRYLRCSQDKARNLRRAIVTP